MSQDLRLVADRQGLSRARNVVGPRGDWERLIGSFERGRAEWDPSRCPPAGPGPGGGVDCLQEHQTQSC